MISTYSDFIFPLFAHSYPIHNTQGSQESDTNLNFRFSVRFRIPFFWAVVVAFFCPYLPGEYLHETGCAH